MESQDTIPKESWFGFWARFLLTLGSWETFTCPPCRVGLDRLAFGSQLFLFLRQLGNVTIFPQKPWSTFAVVLLSRQALNFREGEGRVEAYVLIHI